MPGSAAALIWLALAAAAVTGDASASDGGPLLPVGLRTELEPSPFGVRLDSTGGIEVSWELSAVPPTLKNKTQSAYELTVAEVGGRNKSICTTGKVASSYSSSVPLCGTGHLRPGQLYQVCVCVCVCVCDLALSHSFILTRLIHPCANSGARRYGMKRVSAAA